MNDINRYALENNHFFETKKKLAENLQKICKKFVESKNMPTFATANKKQ